MNKHLTPNLLPMLLPMLFMQLLIQPAAAEEICVTNSSELHDALAAAANNFESDEIKITQGHYPTSGQTFAYEENIGWDLSISGGWLPGSNCTNKNIGNPFMTTLTAGGSGLRILSVQAGGLADVTISDLEFLSGGNANLSIAGGLIVYPPSGGTHNGRITIERNVFIGNQAGQISALLLDSTGPKTSIRNNLFLENQTHDGSFTLAILQNQDSGVYLTNNTLIHNEGDAANNVGGVWLSTTPSSNTYIGNNVLFHNGNGDLAIAGHGDVYLHHNNLGLVTGEVPFSQQGNIVGPPELIQALGSFTPVYGSNLVNAGFDPPNAVPNPTPFELAWFEGTHDLMGNPRKQQGQIDIGAVELGPEPPIFANGFE